MSAEKKNPENDEADEDALDRFIVNVIESEDDALDDLEDEEDLAE